MSLHVCLSFTLAAVAEIRQLNRALGPKAFVGAAAIFAVTNYWHTMSKEREEQQGRTIVDAAKGAQIQRLIYSSLIDVAKATNGKLAKVYHFDSKAMVEQYARDSGIPATFYQPGFFMSNIPGQLLSQESPDKPWTLAIPTSETAPFPIFDTEADTGKSFKAIVLKRNEVSKDSKFFSLPYEMFTAPLKGRGMPDFVAEKPLQNFNLMDEVATMLGRN
ncbi:NmrA-like family domain-containing protein [Trichoderma evansii]